jgi:hypothetical protein
MVRDRFPTEAGDFLFTKTVYSGRGTDPLSYSEDTGAVFLLRTCQLKVKFTLQHALKAHRGSKDIFLLIL